MDTQVLKRPRGGPPPPLLLTFRTPDGAEQTRRFTKSFNVGRGAECDVTVDDVAVSRIHAELACGEDGWWLRDLQSTNGTFVDAERIDNLPILDKTKVILGPGGPVITLELEGVITGEETVVTPGAQRTKIRSLVSSTTRNFAAQQRVLVKKAVEQALHIQSRRYVRIIGAISILAIGAAGYAYYSYRQLAEQRDIARRIFYEMKDLELSYSRLEARLVETTDTVAQAEAQSYLRKMREMNESYDKFIGELGVYREGMDEKERTIYRVARVFGECELNMPGDFAREVLNYVDLWKRSDRLVSSIERARTQGFAPIITDAMLLNHLPPQFFYLALQESEFDTSVCGPATRFGIAKGMWQFIPSTAMRYGLRTGPLVQLPRTDPRDDRHRASKSTRAAARYLRDIYNTEAQASGLLVMASYNWGHNVVRGLIREMPENPTERNFWKFLETYRDRIPRQTYDYVFYIFSAAVIGENPRAFGFGFDNPLAPYLPGDQASR